MRSKKSIQISILVATAVITLGCTGGGQPAAKAQPQRVQQAKPQAVVVPQQSAGLKLADLQNMGAVRGVSIEGNKVYENHKPIQFIVDTKGREGYLYIVYADDKGGTVLLYPNANSPLSEMGGRYLFPRDFGNMPIRATKDCGGCEQEKTSVYALLSKEPIVDIEKITGAQLMGLSGGSGGGSQGKGLTMDLSGGNSAVDADVNFGKIEFFVK